MAELKKEIKWNKKRPQNKMGKPSRRRSRVNNKELIKLVRNSEDLNTKLFKAQSEYAYHKKMVAYYERALDRAKIERDIQIVHIDREAEDIERFVKSWSDFKVHVGSRF